MKIPAFLTCLLAMLLAAVPLHHARADEVNFDVFYNSLADDGDWYNTPEYGYVWQPYIAYKTDKWRPYSDGYWAQTDGGWTWVSYENFGWATYHYGRWTQLKDIGWVWVPGYDWGPGWVSWRTNNDYVGWAPLPPKAEEGVSEGTVAESHRQQAEQIDYNDVEPEQAGYGNNVDVQYDIGPANYCFVETRNFGAPVLSAVILPPQQNFVFIERTRNVTNIYYRREQDRTVVYNNGPDYTFINEHVERPIPRLQLERRDDPGFLRDGLRGGGNPTLVRGGVLQVASPMIGRRPMNFAQIKPARIKQTLAAPQVVHGWSNSGADQATTQRIREQYKQQAASAPPRPAEPVIPTAAPARARVDHAASNPAPVPATAQPFVPAPSNQPGKASNAPVTDADRLARRDARQKERDQRTASGQPSPAAGIPAAPAATQPHLDQEQDARGMSRQGARATGQATPAVGAPNLGAQANTDPDKEARRAARQAARANGQAPQPVESAKPPTANTRIEEEAPAPKPTHEKPLKTQPSTSTDPEKEAGDVAQKRAHDEPATVQAKPQPNTPADKQRDERRPERAAQPAHPSEPPSQSGSASREGHHQEQSKPGQTPTP